MGNGHLESDKAVRRHRLEVATRNTQSSRDGRHGIYRVLIQTRRPFSSLHTTPITNASKCHSYVVTHTFEFEYNLETCLDVEKVERCVSSRSTRN